MEAFSFILSFITDSDANRNIEYHTISALEDEGSLQ